jgi:uncharacterized protein (TIGR02996 family)
LTSSSALLELILANPADDTVRLVLADLLRESDDEMDQARGRFLWAGVTAAQFRNDELIDDPIYYTAQREIKAVASAGHPPCWLAELGVGSPSPGKNDWGWDCVHDRVTVRVGKATSLFARGLLVELTIDLVEWFAIASRVLASAPLESASIIDIPGLTFFIDNHSSHWRLTARLKVPTQRIPLMGGPIPTAYSPSPFLMETDADWRVEESFPTRARLVEGVSRLSAVLVDDLREAVGNRWPRPSGK